MNSIGKFIINTFTGGIYFLLPLVVLSILVKKVHGFLVSILQPVNKLLPDHFLGLEGNQVIAILTLVVLCFLTGLLFRSKKLRHLLESLEDRFLSGVPGYTFIMTKLSNRLGQEDDDNLETVIIQQGEARSFGFLVEEGDGLCCVFMPDSPDFKSGSVQILPASAIKKLGLPASAVTNSLKRLGKNSIALLRKAPNA